MMPEKLVNKLWGVEAWIINEPEYCFKVLTLTKGFSSSLHCHLIKKETFICRKGWFYLDIKLDGEESTRILMRDGMTHTLHPGTFHRFWLPVTAEENAVIWEISTHHSDEDVVRETESYKLSP